VVTNRAVYVAIGIDCEGAKQVLACGSVQVARLPFQLAQIRKGRAAAAVVADLAGDGDAVLEQDSRKALMTKTVVGDAEAVQRPCLPVAVAYLTEDSQAPLEQPQSFLEFGLHVQQYPEPEGQQGERCSATGRLLPHPSPAEEL
jgi:hypothetical protein